MANQLNEFDRLIKQRYESHQEPYNPELWEELEEELTVVSPGFSSMLQSALAGVALTAAVFGAMLIFAPSDHAHSGIASTSTPEAEQTHTGVLPMADDEQTQPLHDSTSDSSAEAHAILGVTDSESTAKTGDHDYNRAATDHTNDRAKMPVHEPDNAAVTASVEPSPKKEDLGVRSGCTGMTIRFNPPSDYAQDAKYLWNFGDGYFSNDPNPSHTFNKEGVFDVSLSVTSHLSGQISSNVVQAMIEVAEAPSADFKVKLEGKDRLTVTNISFDASRVEWDLDGKDLGNQSEVSLSLADNTRHTLQLTAFSHTGCSDTLQRTVYVSEADNRFPRAYDPSQGAAFAPGAIIDGGEVSTFRVYRPDGGSEVFRASGNKGWTGADDNGNVLEAGVYEWVMVADQNNDIRVYHGHVRLRK